MTRILIGFLVAPIVPAILLYIFNRAAGHGDAAIVGPFLLALLGYIAALTIGMPVYLLMKKRGVHGFPAYLLLGAVIGPVFYLLFTMLTSYPGQLLAILQHSQGAVLTASVYSAAAGVFWTIAVRRSQSPRDV